MSWTPQQLESLYAGVYQRRLICPARNGPLALDPSRETDVVGAIMGTVECKTCNARHTILLASDPLRPRFRDYTPDENRAIFATERKRLTPTCPIDGTPMDVHLQRSLGLTSNATIRCRRCGRLAEYVRRHG